MALSYYVYYHVDPVRRALAYERAMALFERIARETEVHGRLLARPGQPELFMEVYEPVTPEQPFVPLLERAARELKLAELLAPGAARKLECFERPCA